MEGLNDLERAVLDMLLDGDHPVLVMLRAQAEKSRLSSREYTGVGFYSNFDVPPDVPALETERDFHIRDLNAVVDGVKHGVDFILFVREGRLDWLEGVTFEGPWPNVIRNFKLSYRSEPRSLSFLKRDK